MSRGVGTSGASGERSVRSRPGQDRRDYPSGERAEKIIAFRSPGRRCTFPSRRNGDTFHERALRNSGSCPSRRRSGSSQTPCRLCSPPWSLLSPMVTRRARGGAATLHPRRFLEEPTNRPRHDRPQWDNERRDPSMSRRRRASIHRRWLRMIIVRVRQNGPGLRGRHQRGPI